MRRKIVLWLALLAPMDALQQCQRSTLSMSTNTLPGRWRLSLSLPSANSFTVVTGQFIDDEGYEPPQGKLVLGDGSGEGRWILSEDPDDRKDGLWVWGLFSEPLYPFCLISLPSESVGLPEGGQLALRLNHKARPDDDAPLLTKGSVFLRKVTTINADALGLARASYNDDTAIGTVSAALIQDDQEEVAVSSETDN